MPAYPERTHWCARVKSSILVATGNDLSQGVTMVYHDNNNTKKWVVLVVDDDIDNLNVAEKVLTFYGAQVHTANNGRTGLEKLRDMDKPTFILLDLSMPDMDGWEMLQELRADTECSSLPVIALTAHVMPEDKERTEKAGFNGYIAKPFILSTFMEEIKRCLNEHQTLKNPASDKLGQTK
jgi:two-component system cell cycle response regulator DivK